MLGDQTRPSIVGYLARNEHIDVHCSHFLDFASKTNVIYHLAKLGEAGVIRMEVRGTNRIITLRRADLDQRFPGLLDSIIARRCIAAVRLQEGPRRSRNAAHSAPNSACASPKSAPSMFFPTATLPVGGGCCAPLASIKIASKMVRSTSRNRPGSAGSI